ncbi:polymorphic toxin-type HINT domain-containing protein [Paludisphaera rhizosphaerae]|uniref:polymorphic toxin-type HINT domain-containing protein n=1 Tax=Paludisphaera rhizosphaerae TaxID=2711216 RepID=UPI0013EBFA3D|nr:polymorphic toxin-type HINT domain-containing protein [Paludisphaera rhizosphaerae]
MFFTLMIGLAVLAAAPDGSTDADRSAYEAAAAAAGRDADAQVRLALWCEAHGMAAERLKHLTRAVLLAPDNAKARGLLGQVQRDGKWMRPQDVAKAIENSPDQKALMDEYFARRVKAKDEADDQYKLALWCEEKGLTQPMLAHLHRTLQLDPNREGAWRRLGFKKIGGRWVNPEAESVAKAEREAQGKADKEWRPRLEKIRAALAGKDRAKRALAVEELAAVADPRAVPALWHVFVQGGDESRQKLAVDVLSRIEGPGASVALATLAVFSPHAMLRADAASLLQRRDPREFAGFLANLIQEEIKYKVKPVEGPGGPGELVVETKDKNVRRLYRPFQGPSILPGDWMGRDANGNAVVNRPLWTYVGAITDSRVGLEMISGGPGMTYAAPGYDGPLITDSFVTGLPMVPPGVSTIGTSSLSAQQNPAIAGALLQGVGVPSAVSQRILGQMQQGLNTRDATVAMIAASGFTTRPIIQEAVQIPIQQMEADARASALVARQQLAADMAGIEAQNAPVREVNDRAVAVLKAVSGEDRGVDRDRWTSWVIDVLGYGQPLRGDTSPPVTIVEDVPIAYQPQAMSVVTSSVVGLRIGPSCFAGGTPVRTIQGDRPIETIQPGDLVLSQDTTTGKLSYQPVVEVMHNPPNWTYKIDLGKEAVHPTGIHRFWKAGEGWVMAREIKAGDKLRTVGGVVEVVSAEKEKVQPVFNLLLAGGDNYCVGELGLVAHDNGFVEPVAQPFDGVPATAELVAGSRP